GEAPAHVRFAPKATVRSAQCCPANFVDCRAMSASLQYRTCQCALCTRTGLMHCRKQHPMMMVGAGSMKSPMTTRDTAGEYIADDYCSEIWRYTVIRFPCCVGAWHEDRCAIRIRSVGAVTVQYRVHSRTRAEPVEG